MSTKWEVLVKKCMQQRYSQTKFASYVELLQKDSGIEGRKLCSLVLKRVGLKDGIDPLATKYIEELLVKEIVQPHDVLRALLDLRLNPQPSEDNDGFNGPAMSITRTSTLDHSLLMSLARGFSSDTFKYEAGAMKKLFDSLTSWMNHIVTQNDDMLMQSAASQETMQAVLIESFATLLVTCFVNSHISEQLKAGPSQELSKPLAESFSSFIALMMTTNMPLASRLQMIQKDTPALQMNESVKLPLNIEGEQNLGQLHLDSIVDAEPINTRASFVIYLDGLLDGRPHVSDTVLLGFIQGRYKGDHSTAIVDFLVACFDILAISSNRGDSNERSFVPHSFLTNKAPAIMLYLSSASFVPVDNEYLISQALTRLDPTLFSSFPDASFLDGQAGLLADARRQFLLGCVTLGIIGLDGVERLLGEQLAQDEPFEGRAHRQQFVEECKSSSQKLELVIEKSEAFDGNAPARVEALTEVFHSTCISRDRAALKNLCNQISRRPHVLDAIALYAGLHQFLQPLCFLLAEWKHDDDEGEHHPIYEEFSACVLLLLATASRFRLRSRELGFPAENTFWQLLLQGNISAIPAKDLDESQNRHLSGWTGGLFGDSLGDEVLSSCPPQEFYMLVPTLFQQTVIACKLSALDAEHLTNGLELLLKSFLMPALVPALQWLVSNAEERDDAYDVFFTILASIVNPQSLDDDAANMHKTILSILGDKLVAFLKDFKRRHEKNCTAVQQLIDKLQPQSGYCRAGEATTSQMELWSNGNFNNLLDNLRSCIGTLCFWTTDAGLQATLPTYSHLLVRAAVYQKGAEAALSTIVEETNGQIATGLGDAALDIATAIIASNTTVNADGDSARLGLREVLQLEVVDAPRVFATKDSDHLRMETCVRLNRRVETLMANVATASAEHQHQQTMPMPIPDAIMGDMGLDPATAAAVGLGTGDRVAQSTDASTSDPLGFTGSGADDLQLNIDAVLAGQSQHPQDAQGMTGPVGNQGEEGDNQMPPTAEDDIFGDLMAPDYNF